MSNKYRLAIISRSQSLIDSVEENVKDYSDITLLSKHLTENEDISKLVLELQENRIEAIIARGLTAHEIQNKSAIPVVRCDIGMWDIIAGLYQLKDKVKNIALTIYKEIALSNQDIEMVKDMLGMNIKLLRFESFDDIPLLVEKAKDNMVEQLVCTGQLAGTIAENFELPSVEIVTRDEVIKKCLIQAKFIIDSQRKEFSIVKSLSALVENMNEGIIMIDRDRIIILVNEEASTILGIEKKQLIGKPVEKVRIRGFIELFDPDMKVENKITTIAGTKIVYSTTNVKLYDNEPIGMMCVFNTLEIMKKYGKTLRKEINKGFKALYDFHDIKGTSIQIKNAIKQAEAIASVDFPVLILGETGTGKELFAHAIHNSSKRSSGPFVAVNCAALPQSLLASELFGYEEGAFTGAKRGGKIGLFEIAENGTIFLDEIGDLDYELQSHLLRVLEQNEIIRVGGSKNIPVNVRIISATNKNIQELIAEKKFRLDLYYRLAVLILNIPPLKSRIEDIPELIETFIMSIDKKITYSDIKKAKKEIYERICDLFQKGYRMPGNIRELKNMVISYMTKGTINLFEDFTDKDNTSCCINNKSYLNVPIKSMKDIQSHIITELVKGGKSINEIKDILKISRTTIWRYLREEQ